MTDILREQVKSKRNQTHSSSREREREGGRRNHTEGAEEEKKGSGRKEDRRWQMVAVEEESKRERGREF